MHIPYGSTINYMDLAKKLGDPKCIRAAASANGKNQIAIIVPCHGWLAVTMILLAIREAVGGKSGYWKWKKEPHTACKRFSELFT